MSKPTPRPWRVAATRTDDNSLQIPIVDDYGCIAWLVNRKRPDLFGSDEANAAHIVKCVNAHEELVERAREHEDMCHDAITEREAIRSAARKLLDGLLQKNSDFEHWDAFRELSAKVGQR